VHMEPISGIDLLLQIRERGIDTPVVMISGDHSRSTIMKCLEAGAVDYLLKPFTRADLTEKVWKHISLSAGSAESGGTP